MKFNKKMIIAGVLAMSIGSVSAGDHAKKIGSSLHNKEAVELNNVPAQVTSVILAHSPKFKMLEAEKELKHGNTYFDIEGLDGQGNEIEFDMLLGEDGSWTIAEIQRDLLLEQCPEPVIKLYRQKLANQTPRRIIESDQGGGVIVYEFYVSENGHEKKHEIKLEVTLLEKEWKH